MPTSQNGWPASPDRNAIGVSTAFNINGVTFPGGVKAGDVSAVLGYVAAQFHHRVEPLVPGWCWGWNYRAVSGGTSLSNHASGTAIDCNAPRHPLGVAGTFTAAQRTEIHRILAEVGGVVRWGGDYSGRPDEMHFEINANATAVAAVASRLTEEDDMAGEGPAILAAVSNLTKLIATGGVATKNFPNDPSIAPHSLFGRAGDTQLALTRELPFLRAQVVELGTHVNALIAAVAALSNDADLTADQVRAIVREAVRQSIQITGTVEVVGATNPGGTP